MNFKAFVEYEKHIGEEETGNIKPEIKDFFKAKESGTNKKKLIYYFSGTLKDLNKILKI